VGPVHRKVKVATTAEPCRWIDTRLDKTRVEPADFEKFRKFHDDVNRQYRVWLTLKPTQDIADAPPSKAAAFAPDQADAGGAGPHLHAKRQGRRRHRVLAAPSITTPTIRRCWN